jgi:adenylate cyclase
MKSIQLSELSQLCFDGMVPSVLATCDAEGVPNATWLSHVTRVDERHVALSCQFFRKTVQNLAAHPHALLLLTDPTQFAQYRLTLRYQSMERHGSLFDAMRARLIAVAAVSGMSDVFALESAAVFEATFVECVEVERPGLAPAPPPSHDPLLGLARLSEGLALCTDLASVTQTGLELLATHLGYTSVTLYVLDEAEQMLYALASRGFAPSGVGASVALGVSVVGTCASHRMAIHIPDLMREVRYGRAVREQVERARSAQEREIPLPSLSGAHSSLAIPLLVRGKLLGVLWTESRDRAAFGEHDVPVLRNAGQMLAQCVALHRDDEVDMDDGERIAAPPPAAGPLLHVRYYEADDSVFLDDEYLIKGVSGRVLWLLLKLNDESGRLTFSNRELRLHPFLKLPHFKDNLEARLLMLQRRLEERSCELKLYREQRGRLRIALGSTRLVLDEVPRLA